MHICLYVYICICYVVTCPSISLYTYAYMYIYMHVCALPLRHSAAPLPSSWQTPPLRTHARTSARERDHGWGGGEEEERGEFTIGAGVESVKRACHRQASTKAVSLRKAAL